MKKNCDCSFLFGQQTDPETIRELHNALQAKTAIQKEFIAYKKDGKVIRCGDHSYYKELVMKPGKLQRNKQRSQDLC